MNFEKIRSKWKSVLLVTIGVAAGALTGNWDIALSVLSAATP